MAWPCLVDSRHPFIYSNESSGKQIIISANGLHNCQPRDLSFTFPHMSSSWRSNWFYVPRLPWWVYMSVFLHFAAAIYVCVNAEPDPWVSELWQSFQSWWSEIDSSLFQGISWVSDFSESHSGSFFRDGVWKRNLLNMDILQAHYNTTQATIISFVHYVSCFFFVFFNPP